ncbi:9435_t:CDS:2, partial [Paraglomus brasilianum]
PHFSVTIRLITTSFAYLNVLFSSLSLQYSAKTSSPQRKRRRIGSELSEEDYIDTYDGDNGSEMYYESGKERNGNEREMCILHNYEISMYSLINTAYWLFSLQNTTITNNIRNGRHTRRSHDLNFEPRKIYEVDFKVHTLPKASSKDQDEEVTHVASKRARCNTTSSFHRTLYGRFTRCIAESGRDN